jgi:hypothetical protein
MTGNSRDSNDTIPAEWPSNTPAISKRVSALLKGIVHSNSDHKIQTAIGAKPTHKFRGDREVVKIDLIKIWYVLHYGELGENRTTNIYTKKIGTTHTTPEHMSRESICAMLLPLESNSWQPPDTSCEPPDGSTDD